MMDDGIDVPPFVKALLLGAALVCAGGCGTVATFSDGLKESDSTLSPKPFGGTRLDVHAIPVFCDQEFPLSLLSIAFVLDVPLSAAADVITLPLTIPLHLAQPDEAPPVATPEDPDDVPALERPLNPEPPPSEADVLPVGGGAGTPTCLVFPGMRNRRCVCPPS
jgi:hypothetical protein